MNSTQKILVFKTNLIYKKDIRKAASYLNSHPLIQSWNVDRHDVDRVLRIVSGDEIPPVQINRLIEEAGFFCAELCD